MYQVKDRVVKIGSAVGIGTKYIETGARGEVLRLTPPGPGLELSDYPYVQVRFDSNLEKGIVGGIEWCFDYELVRADAYDQFVRLNEREPTTDDVTSTDNGVQLLEVYPDEQPFIRVPGEIVGDGPTPQRPVGPIYDTLEQYQQAVDLAADIVGYPEAFNLTDSEYRKMQPVGTVATEYFPLGDRGRAAVSWLGNEKHNPGEYLHWSRGKSDDHENALLRHLQDMKAPGSDGWDTVALPDGRVFQIRHAAAVEWRASAIAQLDAESVGGQVIRRLK